MIRKIVIAIGFIAALMLSKANVIRGGSDFPTLVDEVDFNVFTSAYVAQIPVNHVKVREAVTVTAYSSRPQETDDTPFIAASGKHVFDGMVAANWLPFGAKVRIPELFGDKVFVVEDRMHRRNSEKLDIWFASTREAIKFGVKKVNIEIL